MGIIRILLAISVAIHHTGPIFGHTLFGGDGIVQSFFVISGFYVTMIYTEKSYSRKLEFYKSRFFRRPHSGTSHYS